MKRGQRASLLEKLSQPILTFSERHPKIRLKTFSYLRDLREEQIKSANEFLEASKRPSDNDLALHSLFIYDIFFAESFCILEKGLDKIYQSKSDFFLDREIASYKEFINTTAPSLTTIAAYINLPLLYDAAEHNLWPNGIRFGPMPGGIRYIQLRLSRTLPSFIILSAHIIFNNKISEKLDGFINGYFEKKISLRSFRAKRFGYSASLPEIEKAKTISEFISGYKTNVENLLKGYLGGLYLSSGQKCPSVEIYTISKLNISDDLIHRRSGDSDFWKTMRFEWSYQNLIFSCPPFTLFFDPQRELS